MRAMNRSRVMLVCSACCVSLAGCSGGNSEQADASKEASPPPAAAPAEKPAIPESFPNVTEREVVETVPEVGEADAVELAESPEEPEGAQEVIARDEPAAAGSAYLLDFVDQSFARVLSDVVTPEGLVRYDLLSMPLRTSMLQRAVQGYAEITLPEARPARIAVLCNAYNANSLLKTLNASRTPGFSTVEATPGFFDEDEIKVAGQTMTLNALENEHVRPIADARVHAALVCGALSCPPLRREPYDGDRLDTQLDEQCRRWVNDDSKFTVIDKELAVSQILKWYAEDFTSDPFGSPVEFVKRYADPDSRLAELLAEQPEPQLTYLYYDWSLNQAPITSQPEK